MKITFTGHAGFYLEGPQKILIDPFISENPNTPVKNKDLAPELILITHGHNDHLGDALEIAQNTGAPILTSFDLAKYLSRPGVNTIGINIGGTYSFKNTKIKMTQAWHSSSITMANGTFYGGTAAGFLIQTAGLTLYHAGDTALFGDMEKVIARTPIDVAFLPIGGHFTMGPDDALIAAHWLKARQIIPMHYNTFPLINQDAEAFALAVKDRTESNCLILKAGEWLEVAK